MFQPSPGPPKAQAGEELGVISQNRRAARKTPELMLYILTIYISSPRQPEMRHKSNMGNLRNMLLDVFENGELGSRPRLPKIFKLVFLPHFAPAQLLLPGKVQIDFPRWVQAKIIVAVENDAG